MKVWKVNCPSLRITGPCYRGVWMCIARVWDLQTTSFEIPWFLGLSVSWICFSGKFLGIRSHGVHHHEKTHHLGKITVANLSLPNFHGKMGLFSNGMVTFKYHAIFHWSKGERVYWTVGFCWKFWHWLLLMHPLPVSSMMTLYHQQISTVWNPPTGEKKPPPNSKSPWKYRLTFSGSRSVSSPLWNTSVNLYQEAIMGFLSYLARGIARGVL